jgi:hypothetical protein
MKKFKKPKNLKAFQTITKLTSSIPTCSLCRTRPAAYGNVYVPQNQGSFFAPAGKFRAFGYGLCEVCARDPRAAEAVERQIEREFHQARVIQAVSIRADGSASVLHQIKPTMACSA